MQEDQIESHNGRIKSLEKELEEHKAYHSGNVNRKGKSNQVSSLWTWYVLIRMVDICRFGLKN